MGIETGVTGTKINSGTQWGYGISFGSGNAHNHGNTGAASNLPPYLAVYIWKRTA